MHPPALASPPPPSVPPLLLELLLLDPLPLELELSPPELLELLELLLEPLLLLELDPLPPPELLLPEPEPLPLEPLGAPASGVALVEQPVARTIGNASANEFANLANEVKLFLCIE